MIVQGTADQLTRAVSNLLDNATRYAASTVQVSLGTPTEDTIRLVVDDDGVGIAAENQEMVFERFARLDDSRSRNNGGAGLGLAVVRSIVTRHHGQVWAEPSPLGGARFVVDLPAEPSDAVHRRRRRTRTAPEAISRAG